MARHLRVEFPGAIYHVTCRMVGDWRTEETFLFKDDADRERFLDRLAEMSGKRREWPKRYREFVESGLAESDDDFQVALKLSPRSIGGDGFRAWIDELYQKRLDKHARPEDVSFRRITEPLPAGETLSILAEIFDVETEEFKRRRHSSPLRAVAARFLIRYAGRSQRDVADLLGIGSGAAVCNQLNRLTDKLVKDRRLRRQVAEAEKRLEEARCAQRVERG